MKKIDWSEAPADATHYLRLREDSGEWFDTFWRIDSDGHASMAWRVGTVTAFSHVFIGTEDRDLLIPRPTTWTGTGLPPVGTVCEVREPEKFPGVAFADWSQCTVVAHNTGSSGAPQVCTIDCCGDFAIFYPTDDGTEFRPIRTPEQIAAEEREKTLKDMHRVFHAGIARDGHGFKALYDEDYRKVEGGEK